MTVTPVEKISVDKLKVPKGFKVEIWAHGMPGARMMTRGDKGTVFIGTRVIGKVYAVTDKDGKREHKVVAEGQQQPNGLAFKDGTLYVITIDKVLRFDGIEDKLDRPAAHRRVSDKFNMPPSTHHNWKFAAIGPDNKIYFVDRRTLQHLRDRSGQVWADPSPEPRRLGHRDRGARRTQLGRLRLASADQGAVVHRQRPRLGRRRRPG